MLTFRRIEYACASLLLAAIVVLVGVAAVTRGLGSPIIWSVEIAQLLFAWLCMLAADLALQGNRHFGLTILLDRLPPGARRRVEIVNMLVLIGLLGFLLFHAWRNMILMHPSLLGATQMHGSYVHASMVVGLALLARTMTAQLLARLRGRDPA